MAELSWTNQDLQQQLDTLQNRQNAAICDLEISMNPMISIKGTEHRTSWEKDDLERTMNLQQIENLKERLSESEGTAFALRERLEEVLGELAVKQQEITALKLRGMENEEERNRQKDEYNDLKERFESVVEDRKSIREKLNILERAWAQNQQSPVSEVQSVWQNGITPNGMERAEEIEIESEFVEMKIRAMAAESECDRLKRRCKMERNQMESKYERVQRELEYTQRELESLKLINSESNRSAEYEQKIQSLERQNKEQCDRANYWMDINRKRNESFREMDRMFKRWCYRSKRRSSLSSNRSSHCDRNPMDPPTPIDVEDNKQSAFDLVKEHRAIQLIHDAIPRIKAIDQMVTQQKSMIYGLAREAMVHRARSDSLTDANREYQNKLIQSTIEQNISK